jgi:hypothetical protein
LKGLAVSKRKKISRSIINLALTSLSIETAQAAMPPAKVPIEPAMSDKEFYSDEPASTHASRTTETQSAGPSFLRSAPSSSGVGEAGDFGAALRLSMIKDGFGAQIKLMEYPRSWLALTQTFRYFKNDESDRLHRQRQGFLLGIDMHPWRKSFVSPFLNSQVGWERFYRDEDLSTLDSFVAEASAGLELRLGRLASVVGQWTESYYPGLKEQVFLPQKSNADPKRHATAEVLFNLKWETN